MNDAQKLAQAICIEDGKIVYVGSNEQALSYQDATSQVIDLQGQVMMPAFIDPHSHFFGVANALNECDLTEATCFDDIVNMLQKFMKEKQIPKGEWILGRNYDQNFLKEKAHPTKDVLDQVSKEHKVCITHVSNHMGCANTLALQAKQVTADMLDPAGGKIGRMPNSNEPSGYLEENAFLNLMHSAANPSAESIVKNVQEAQKIYASYGITTVQDGMVAQPLFDILSSVAKNNLLYLDVVGYADVVSCQHLITPQNCSYHNHFRLGGYKIFLDGSPQGCTAWMSKPYENQGDYCGYPIYTDEQLEEYARVAIRDHQQLLAHANGDQASEQFISAYERIHAQNPDSSLYHPVLVHCQLTRQDQLERMPALGMIPTFFVAHTYYWGDIHIQNFGQERGSLISSVKTAFDLGLPYTFHQDSPVVPCDMMKSVWCAVNRISRGGHEIGPSQRMDVYNALKAITIHGAIQYGEEKEKGSLEVGKQANLVLLSDNPLTMDSMKLDQIQVMETIHQGNTVFKR